VGSRPNDRCSEVDRRALGLDCGGHGWRLSGVLGVDTARLLAQRHQWSHQCSREVACYSSSSLCDTHNNNDNNDDDEDNDSYNQDNKDDCDDKWNFRDNKYNDGEGDNDDIIRFEAIDQASIQLGSSHVTTFDIIVTSTIIIIITSTSSPDTNPDGEATQTTTNET